MRRDRRLREAVLARSACLGDLSRPQRIVLKLRAGVGAAAPRSRAAVARRLRITIRRVTRLEHSGLRRLRAACAAATTHAATSADASVPPAPGSTLAEVPSGQPVSDTRGPAGTATPTPSVESEGPADQGGVAGTSVTNLPQPGKGGLNLWIPLFLLACGAAGFVVARALSRPVVADGGAPTEPAPYNWATPPAGGTEAPPTAAPPPPAPRATPAAADDAPTLPSHRSPSPRR